MKTLLLLCLLPAFLACSGQGPAVQIVGKTTAGGNQYSLFYPQGTAIQITTTRPDAANSRYQLSVAAAYTDLDTDQPLDLLVSNGRELQPRPKVGFLDGMLMLVNDSLAITRIPEQSQFRAAAARMQRQSGTLLLQELLVQEGRSVHAAGGSAFQRRALVELADHRFVVAESVGDDLTLKQFGDDLRELGARNALYLDMGDWDEGWYKTGGRVVKLGHRRTETARQSNWLVMGQLD
ncbi:phosphodiester glycosidase family protein [Hymenobacter monticola]|uniref:Phosphodiester glycosidase family protein n=1 Tax=Hymenobacter monticola TaxID=1705399 RepID=A0ABY4B0C3_9BACT|nr:phosphodiester glycosidase family protein [Hymenobacter monticola]UOE32598.1 phosphodiester glycosidase family protein [Hymenobacter monticola]